MKFSKNVCVIGMWHLGCVTAGCLANIGNRVTCFDFDTKLIDDLEKGKLPIYEPGLKELFTECVAGNKLHFSLDLKKTIPTSEYVYITFDTPVDDNDRIDLSIIHRTVDNIIPLLSKDAVIVISSQVPVRTCDLILEKIRRAGKRNELCYVPENLRLGNAIDSFMKPERLVFGLSSFAIKERIKELFSGIDADYLFMDLKSAEMTKHALNSYLAALISFSGEISDLCEKTGANAIEVMNALKAEKRVSSYAPIIPGLGFAGGTLARDVQILRELGHKTNTRTDVLDAVLSVNTQRMKYISNKLLSLFGSLDKKRIAFFGLTYKAGTNTLRRSPALQVIDQIRETNVIIQAYDPMIKEQIENYEYVTICKSAEKAAEGSDALIIITDWDEFKNIDYIRIAEFMRNPTIIDTKNMLDVNIFKGTNIRYYGIGVVSEDEIE